MTIAMLSLAGFPATVGFFGKLYLIQAAVDNEYAWLGIVIVIGSAISLVYYLRVIAAVWMRPAPAPPPAAGGRVPGARPAMAGGSPEADAEREGDGEPRRRWTAESRRRRPCAGRAPTSRARASPVRRMAGRLGSPRRARRRLAAVRGRSGARQPEVAFVAVVLRAGDRRRSGSTPSRSSTSPAMRARRSPRWSSAPALPHRAVTASPRGDFPRAAPMGRGTSPSTPAPRRRPGLARVRRAARARRHGVRRGRAGGGAAGVPRSRAGRAHGVASSAATSAARRTRRRPGSRRARCRPAARRRPRGHRAVGPASAATTSGSSRSGRTARSRSRWSRGRRARGERRRSGSSSAPVKARLEGEVGLRVAVGTGVGVRRRRDRAAVPRRHAMACRRAPGAGRPPGAPARPGWPRRAGRAGARGAGEGGGALGGRAAGIEVAAASAIGARIERGRTTLYLRAQTRARVRPACCGGCSTPAGAGRWSPSTRGTAAGPRELAFRGGGARRARAARSSRPSRGWTCACRPTAPSRRGCCATRRRGRRRRARPAGSGPPGGPRRHRGAQRLRGATTTRARSTSPARLGAELGIEGRLSKVDRRLARGRAPGRAGSPERAREDCLAAVGLRATGARGA